MRSIPREEAFDVRESLNEGKCWGLAEKAAYGCGEDSRKEEKLGRKAAPKKRNRRTSMSNSGGGNKEQP